MFRLEYLNEYKIRLEHTRAQANEELIDTLHEYEMDESARFEGMERQWQKQRDDPDDVFFEAWDRKQEIKQQIKELQRGLGRHHPKNKSPKRKRRSR